MKNFFNKIKNLFQDKKPINDENDISVDDKNKVITQYGQELIFDTIPISGSNQIQRMIVIHAQKLNLSFTTVAQ